jgi:hypothetical protein
MVDYRRFTLSPLKLGSLDFLCGPALPSAFGDTETFGNSILKVRARGRHRLC